MKREKRHQKGVKNSPKKKLANFTQTLRSILDSNNNNECEMETNYLINKPLINAKMISCRSGGVGEFMCVITAEDAITLQFVGNFHLG